MLNAKKENKALDTRTAKAKAFRDGLYRLIDSLTSRDISEESLELLRSLRGHMVDTHSRELVEANNAFVDRHQSDADGSVEAIHRHEDQGGEVVYLFSEHLASVESIPWTVRFSFGNEDAAEVCGWLFEPDHADEDPINPNADGLALRAALQKIALHLESVGAEGF
ncbi:hypothetical protein [Rosistilla oblonga]|uniref:hypothetical protein n=1 Tax=Rosistilla oblonga TaxID=2527990 RepID=UPI003A968ED3